MAAHLASSHPDPVWEAEHLSALRDWATLPKWAGSLGPTLANREQRDGVRHLAAWATDSGVCNSPTELTQWEYSWAASQTLPRSLGSLCVRGGSGKLSWVQAQLE